MRVLAFPAFLLTLAVVPVAAQSPIYQRCIASAAGNKGQIFACNQKELRLEDKRVDADFRQMQRRAMNHPQRQADVRSQQRDWLQHRDFACSKADDAENMPCLIRETAAEADKLDGQRR